MRDVGSIQCACCRDEVTGELRNRFALLIYAGVLPDGRPWRRAGLHCECASIERVCCLPGFRCVSERETFSFMMFVPIASRLAIK